MQLPFDFMLPKVLWTPPACLPNLTHVRKIAIDVETHDPNLTSKGPSCLRGEGKIAGISLAWRDSERTVRQMYLPIGHSAGNLDRGIVTTWLSDLLKQRRTWVVAGGQYDLLWLETLGLRPEGDIWDIQIADTLLDEERPEGYSLEAVGRRWLGLGKDENTLNEAANAFGLRPKEDMHLLPAKYVGTYAEIDAVRTLEIEEKQRPAIEAEDLVPAMQLEMQLLPILAAMTHTGIPIDQNYGDQLNRRWRLQETEILGRLKLSMNDIWLPEVVAAICKRNHIPPLTTEKGNDSFGKDHLASFDVPEIKDFLTVRAINRTRTIYLEQNLLINPYRGRLHPQYVQMASDEGGTRTYRLACKNPNAQQFPKRSRLFDAKALRKCLVPEQGCQWAKLDYWSQEPVLQNHYALQLDLPGAQEVYEAFQRGEKLYGFIEKATGGACNYDQSKEVVLGRSYGMGVPKMSARMSISREKCNEVLMAFDEAVPYIKLLADYCSNTAQTRGYIKTILGYRRRFNYWQPRKERNEEYEYHQPLPLEQAKAKWPGRNLERAWTYKAFNALIQGGSANQAKKSVVLAWEADIRPNLLVHDEINSGTIRNEKEALLLKEIMETAIPLKSIVRADLDLGASWQ